MAYAYYRAFFNGLMPPASAVNFEPVFARIYRKSIPLMTFILARNRCTKIQRIGSKRENEKRNLVSIDQLHITAGQSKFISFNSSKNNYKYSLVGDFLKNICKNYDSIKTFIDYY